jgi:hydrogenase expression/formation protein HypE
MIGAEPSRSYPVGPAATSHGAQASRGEQTRPEDRESREERVIDRITAVRKRRSRLTDEVVTLAHGEGGKPSAALVDSVFVGAFRNPQLEQLGDAAVLTLPSGERLAFSTDSFVVSPLRFPGGSIGHLAVHGTVNDLAVSGAVPRWLSAAFVIEEGFAVSDLRAIAADMAAAAVAADVTLVTGDTKVVPKGSADGLYITTAGVGLIPAGRELSAARVRPGDKVLLSGTLADHGIAVLLARGDLGIAADIRSDTAAVGGAVEAVLAAAPGTRWMRDPTRGGLGTVCNQLAADAGLAVILDEEALPVAPLVQGACGLLGIDPLYVACEGKFAAVVPAEQADAALAALRAHPLGRDACVVGEIRDHPAGIVALRNAFGGSRIVDRLAGRPSVVPGG